MEQVEVSMNEWAFTQGMVGYKRILESYGVYVPTTNDGFVVTKEQLKVLPDAFFYYFLNKYSVAKRHEKILNSWHSKWKKGNKNVKSLLNSRLKEIETKISKYFKDTDAGHIILEHVKSYRNEKTYHEVMDDWLNRIIENLYTREIDEKLTCNTFKTIYFQPYFGQVSFLNVIHNTKNIEGQKQLLMKDFIQPVLDEWDFIQAIDQGSTESAHNVLQHTEHKSLGSLKRPLKNKNSEEMNEYIQEEVLKCSLTDFRLGFFSFEESVFSPLALSLKNALNSTWNSDGKNYFPISALAKLLLFCAPAGATISNGKSVFIQFDGSFEQIYHTNEHYNTEADEEMSFDEVVFDLVSEQRLKADMLKKNYLILEYESDYKAKKTMLDYMILTPNLIHLFENTASFLDISFIRIEPRLLNICLKAWTRESLFLKHSGTRLKIIILLWKLCS
ncbi:Cas8a1 family CRISPR/Cas system-associated protein [Lentibacillus cibarius]|uniref:Cas8a1 family CRISPR/Cas system-associated protein n=1 Tax=Lentibacillus cibarius TaxID=2583219 RepID=UPI0014861583|nr:Cas8a1 family CRISPR/Cas system-associated protein [Lentibacillus cibarius]